MNVMIRPYQPGDRLALRQIAFDTALAGKSARIFFDGEEFLKDVLTVYFTDHEPESAWVAEADGRVAGYIIGAKDESEMKKVFVGKILPDSFVELLRSGMLFKTKNLKLIKGLLKASLSGEFKMPDFEREYPAVLHINLSDGLRGAGIGTSLIKVLTEGFSSAGVKGVRLATMSDEAAEFFRKNGFSLLFKGKRSYFRGVIDKDMPLYVFGMKLNQNMENKGAA